MDKNVPESLQNTEDDFDDFYDQWEYYPENGLLPDSPQPLPWGSQYLFDHRGIYITTPPDDEHGDAETKWIFSPLLILARTRDANNQNWGLLLAVQTPDKCWHKWSMPMALLASNGNAYREVLLRLGLRLEAGSQKHLQNYLSTAEPQDTVRCVNKTGWYHDAFVMHDVVYGYYNEEIVLQSKFPDTLFKQQGELEEWKEKIGGSSGFSVGNPCQELAG